MIRPSVDQPSLISLKRIYEAVAPEDGYRILVDRLWPRGISKQEAAIDEWMKICELMIEQQITLVYAAKDSEHNHANVLHKWLLSR